MLCWERYPRQVLPEPCNMLGQNRRLASFSLNQKAFVCGLLCFSLLCPRQDWAVLSGPLAVN